jgi:acyl-CoA thioesterase-1
LGYPAKDKRKEREMKQFRTIVALAALGFSCICGEALAASGNIVALGASNTYGMGQGRHPGGVSPNQAYPAQLESLLRARGIDARVTNAGVPGDTTAGMYARLSSAVPQGTQIVILQSGGNDARKGSGAETSGNVSQITAALRARGIKIVMLDQILSIAPRSTHDPDGQHL